MPPPARSPLVPLFLTVFIDLMGFGIVIPLLPIYAERFDATPFAAGALVAIYSLMQLVFAPVWGALSDRVGRRPMLLMSLVSSALSYLVLGSAGSLGVLFAARVLAGIAGASIPVAQAYIADVTGEHDRTRGMGIIGAAFGLGMVIGPAIGGGLSLLGARVPELFAAGLCLANAGIAAAWLPESLLPARRRPAELRHPLSPGALRAATARAGAATLFAIFFLVTLAFAVLEGTFSLAAAHLHGYGPAGVDVLWFYMGLVAVVVQGGIVGRLARRMPEEVLVAGGTVALTVGLAWVPYAEGRLGLVTALALVVGGHGTAGPALSSLISKAAAPHAQGGTLGVSQGLSSGARVLGPAGGGLIFELVSPHAAYLASAACAAGAVGLGLSIVRRVMEGSRAAYRPRVSSAVRSIFLAFIAALR